MKHPIISKHIRIKVYRTPILEELVSYSRKSGRPNATYLESICKVWRGLSGKDQCSYKHIPEMSTDLTKYLNSSASPGSSPSSTSKSGKNFSPMNRSFSNRLKKIGGSSKKIMMSSRSTKRKRTNLSPETKNIAINLNKHKLEEEENMLRPKYLTQKLTQAVNLSHKHECNCDIKEVPYQLLTPHHISTYKIFLSCRTAASNLPDLIKYSIHAVLSIGEQPNHYPSITGGYFQIVHDGSLRRTLFLSMRFLNTQLFTGNILIHCDTGNKLSVVILMAYLLSETKMTYLQVMGLLKQVRPNAKITGEEENFIRGYDSNKAGVVS